MSNYLARVLRGRTIGTLQTQPQPEKDQVENSAGGYGYTA